MARCFCGCGMKVRFGLRPVNTRGKRVLERVEDVRELRERIRYSPTLDRYVEDGLDIATVIADAVHTDTNDERLEIASKEWLRRGRRYTTGGLGKAIRESGLDVETAAAKMQAGKFDPFRMRIGGGL